MHWNGAPVEARHHHMRHVFSAQQTYATNFFLKLWYDFIEKCIIQNFLRKILAQAIINVHENIFQL